jgi:uncharacterized protein with FMN-binding domain
MAVPNDLTNILDPNETVELYIKQKFYHLTIDIDSVIITNKRVILRHPHALGLKKDYTDYNYIDFEDATIDKGILRSTIRCKFKSNIPPLILNDIPNADAEKAYRIVRDKVIKAQTQFLTEVTGNEMIICSYCGTKNKLTASRCVNCGASLT